MTHTPSQMPTSVHVAVVRKFSAAKYAVEDYLGLVDATFEGAVEYVRAASVPSDKEKAEALDWIKNKSFSVCIPYTVEDAITKAITSPDQSETIKALYALLQQAMSTANPDTFTGKCIDEALALAKKAGV